MLNLTVNFQTAASRLATHLDMNVVKDGRKLKLIPPDYMLDEYEKAGMGHDPNMIARSDIILGSLIFCLHSPPHVLSYKQIWDLCKLDSLVDLKKGGWWMVEIVKMIKSGRGY